MGCAERVANQNSGSRAKPSTEEEIKSRTIGRGGSNSTIPARRDLAFLVVPFEHDVAMAGSECERWKRTVGRENTLEGWRGRNATDCANHNKECGLILHRRFVSNRPRRDRRANRIHSQRVQTQCSDHQGEVAANA